MRAARPAVVALLGVAAVLLTTAPALAATGPSLSLSAGHGPAGASVTATFSYPSSWTWSGPTCSGPVTFRWDGRPVAQARPGSDSRTCSASLTITPQPGSSGSHTVSGSAPNAGSAQAMYTIDSGPTPMAAAPAPAPAAPSSPATADVRIASAADKPQPTPSASPTRQSPSARPTPSAGSPSLSAVAAAGVPGSAAPGGTPALIAMDAPTVVVRPAVSTPLGVWVLMAGGALIMLGATLVGAVRLFRRKRRIAFSL